MYDIDKMNLYIPNSYKKNGKYIYYEYINDENSEELFERWVEEERSKALRDILSNDSAYKSFNTQINNIKEKLKSLYAGNEEFLNEMAESMEEYLGKEIKRGSFREMMESFDTAIREHVGLTENDEKRYKELKNILDTNYRSNVESAVDEGVFLENFKELVEERQDIVDKFNQINRVKNALFERRKQFSESFSEEVDKSKKAKEAKLKASKTRKRNLMDNYKQEFNMLSLDKKNGIKAIENRITEIQREILLMPENYDDLMYPLNSDTLESAANLINNLRQNKNTWDAKVPMRELVDRLYLTTVSDRYMAGKQSVGISALGSTFSVFAQNNDIQINDDGFNLLKDNRREDGWTSLGELYNQGGEYIPTLFNEWISAAVDSAKKPFMSDLNASPQTLNVILMLTMMGVSTNDIALFMNQPIIRDYITKQSIYESQMAESNGLSMSKKKLTQLVKKDYGKSLSNNGKPLSSKTLEDMIVSGYAGRLNSEQNGLQSRILDAFIKYQDMAKSLNRANQGTTYDTKGGGKNIAELLYTLDNTEVAMSDEVLKNYEGAMDNGYFQSYYSTMASLPEKFKRLFSTLRDEQFMNNYNKMMRLFVDGNVDENGNTTSSIPREKVIYLMNKYRTEFITYMIQNTTYTNNLGNEVTIGSRMQELFYGDNSVPNRIKALKNNPNAVAAYPILDIFVPIIRKDDFHSLKPIKGNLDALDLNVYTQAWRDLAKADSLGEDLLHYVIIQAGLSNSPMNFIDIAPYEMYETISDRLNYDVVRDKAFYDAFNKRFFVNNYNNRDLVPYGKNKNRYLPMYTSRVLKSEYKGKTKEQLAELTSRGVSVWDTVLYGRESGKQIDTSNNTKLYRENKVLNNYWRATKETQGVNQIQGEQYDSYDLQPGELLEDYDQTTGETMGSDSLSSKLNTLVREARSLAKEQWEHNDIENVLNNPNLSDEQKENKLIYIICNGFIPF